MTWQIAEHGHVAVVTMDTDHLNAQGPEFFADLHATFDLLDDRYARSCVVLTAAGSVFSVGLDLDFSLELFASKDTAKIGALLEAHREVNLRLFRFPRPLIAAVNGHAIAGGLITALNCDYRIGHERAKFGVNEVPVGIPMPAAYIEIIRNAVGGPAAEKLMLLGRIHDGRQAYRLGILDEVVADADVLPRAVEVASEISPDAFPAYAATKAAFRAEAEARIARARDEWDHRFLQTVTADTSLRAQRHTYRQIKGTTPAFSPTRTP